MHRLAFPLAGALLAVVAASTGAQYPLPPRAGMPLPVRTSIRMTDVTAAANIQFVHVSGGTGRYYYVESVGPGSCFLDYDTDGWLDIFLVQGGPLPVGSAAPPSDLLYRNNRDGTFRDVTREAGVVDRRYGLGCAAADYDNDGDPDLFVTNLDGSVLYRNDKGRFVDGTRRSGVSPPPLATSAAFVDADHDGWLDLFVARYMDYSIETDKPCKAGAEYIICSPLVYPSSPNRLYRNNRNGTFSDVSGASGIAARTNHGFGIATADFNEDGRIDVFVSSDQVPNLLFLGQADGTFRDTAAAAGVAVASTGQALAGMGVDLGDYDRDGLPDLFITNFEYQENLLYRNRGDGSFADESRSSGVEQISRFFLGWGARFVDLDTDGREEIFVVNGHVDDRAERRFKGISDAQRASMPQQGHAQRAQVYMNLGNGRFVDGSFAAGEFFMRRQVGRGAAFGDYDNDGDVDALIAANNGPAILLRNDSTPTAPWARLELRGAGDNRDGIGARVRVTAGGITQTLFVRSGGSYLSDHDRRVLFALPGGGPGEVQIRWPCGATQMLTVRAGQALVVQEQGCRLPAKGRGTR